MFTWSMVGTTDGDQTINTVTRQQYLEGLKKAGRLLMPRYLTNFAQPVFAAYYTVFQRLTRAVRLPQPR